ncbi:hypothetical protein TNCV_853031 [Trichonephila clavipes]|nr:hypothetical protein TNCV_853031 [Trichonephila clavipes]
MQSSQGILIRGPTGNFYTWPTQAPIGRTWFHPSNITERYRYSGHRVVVWESIAMNERTEIHFFDRGSVIGDRYKRLRRRTFPMGVCSEVLLDQISVLWITMHGHTGLLMLSSY